jgi:hypothetical protein
MNISCDDLQELKNMVEERKTRLIQSRENYIPLPILLHFQCKMFGNYNPYYLQRNPLNRWDKLKMFWRSVLDEIKYLVRK